MTYGDALSHDGEARRRILEAGKEGAKLATMTATPAIIGGEGYKAYSDLPDVQVDADAGNRENNTLASALTENDKQDIDFSVFPQKIHEGKQGKHIVGHNNYVPGKSIISVSNERLSALVKKYSGRGNPYGQKEVVDFEEVIGQYIDMSTGEILETTIGTIHYSKNGIHVVPAKPKERRY